MPEGTVNVPTVGRVKKTYAYAGVAVVGVLAVLYYRSKKSKAGTSTGAGTSGAAAGLYPPDGTTGNPQDPYSTDPATGQTYGNEASGQYGSAGYGAGAGGGAGGGGGSGGLNGAYPWDGTTGNPADPFSMDPLTGTTYGNEGNVGGSGTGTGGPPFGTNAQWSQYAIQQLVQNASMDPGTVTNALGAYINGAQVTAAQETIINDAIAVAGPVPVTGHNGYPPSIHVVGSKTGGTGSGGGGGGGGAAVPVNPPGQLRVTGVTSTSATVAWGPLANATTYALDLSQARNPGSVTRGVRQRATSKTYTGLQRRTAYIFKVAGATTAGQGPWSSELRFTTK